MGQGAFDHPASTGAYRAWRYAISAAIRCGPSSAKAAARASSNPWAVVAVVGQGANEGLGTGQGRRRLHDHSFSAMADHRPSDDCIVT